MSNLHALCRLLCSWQASRQRVALTRLKLTTRLTDSAGRLLSWN